MLFSQGMEKFQAVQDFLFGIVAYGTGIHEYGIGFLQIVARGIACHLHDGCDNFTVGYVHLAAIGLDIEFLAHSVYAYVIRLQSYE